MSFDVLVALAPLVIGGLATGFALMQTLNWIAEKENGGAHLEAVFVALCVAPVVGGLLWSRDFLVLAEDANVWVGLYLPIALSVVSVLGGFFLQHRFWKFIAYAGKRYVERQSSSHAAE